MNNIKLLKRFLSNHDITVDEILVACADDHYYLPQAMVMFCEKMKKMLDEKPVSTTIIVSNYGKPVDLSIYESDVSGKSRKIANYFGKKYQPKKRTGIL